MNYRSLSDMASVIRRNLHRLPSDIDVVVGVPRSGLLAASMIGLHLNAKVCGLDSFVDNAPLANGRLRIPRDDAIRHPHEAKHVLLVDDSLATGGSMQQAIAKAESSGFVGKITKCVIFAVPDRESAVDVAMELVALPRAFEWNLLHRKLLERCCLDLDGILCLDPEQEENDDAENYLSFIANATPKHVPTYVIGRIVTSRLEKYRAETEAWLAKHGIRYHKLDMLELADAETRRRRRAHAPFKAQVYALDNSMMLFIESNDEQARDIARLSGKPTLAFGSQTFFPAGTGLPASVRSHRWRAARALRRVRSLLARLAQ